MFSEMKQIYSDQANLIPNQKELSKTELCNLYIENENDEFLKNCYFSAIILRYWNKIYKLQSDTYLTASFEDAYQWVVDSILYALNHRKWLDENNKLFSDPDAPDKVINRRIKCLRINHLISQNRTKRKIQINLLSLDSFDDSDNFLGEYTYKHNFVNDLIQAKCNEYEFIDAIILDLIAFGDCSIEDDLEDLTDTVYQIDDDYINGFSSQYGVDKEKLFDIIKKEFYIYEIQDLWGLGKTYVKKTRKQIKNIVAKEFKKFKNDEELKQLLC